MLLLWFSGLAGLEAVALYAVKYSRVHHDARYLALSMLCYLLLPVLVWVILQYPHEHLATVNLTWNLLSTLYGLAIGIWLFQERLNAQQVWGAMLGVLSLCLLWAAP